MAKINERSTQIDEMILRAIAGVDRCACATDAEGIIRFATDAFAQLCGKPEEELLGSRVGTLFSPGENDRIKAGLLKSSPGDEWHFEIQHTGRDGADFACNLDRQENPGPAGRDAVVPVHGRTGDARRHRR